jgi:hypothetical protein
LKEKLQQIDRSIIDVEGVSLDHRNALLTAQKQIREELKKAPPISLQGFYEHPVMYFWPLMYTCLGVVIFLLPPDRGKGSRQFWSMPTVIILGFVIFVIDSWPLWLRNLADPDPGACVVHAYSNYSVDPASFVVQQLNFCIFAVLLAAIWIQWARSCDRELLSSEPSEQINCVSAVFQSATATRLAVQVLRSQVAFGVLSIGFVYYTGIFWTQIIRNGDRRFLLEAITVHLLRLVTGILIAAPPFLAWLRWRSSKAKAIAYLVTSKSSDEKNFETRLKNLQEYAPVRSWSAIGSALTAIVSFVVPILQAFHH